MGLSYKSAGVDITAGYRAVDLIKGHVSKTLRPGVVTDIGGFGGLFSLAAFKDMDEPVLVSGTDGVGTKLKIAQLMNIHDTIGIDCVAMCVNDIICCGAEPLFVLDYIACGKNNPKKIADIVKGVAIGAKQSNAALIGGETAEMPGFYSEDEYDIAGFAVGIVDKSKIIDGNSIDEGDIIIGLASSGIHSNGYSLVRKVFQETNMNIFYEQLGASLGETLLTPTRIYVNSILSLIKKIKCKGIANITGGGFIENIPRILKKNLCAKINSNWDIPPIFELIRQLGDIEKTEMFNTFNMGIGMIIVVDKDDAYNALNELSALGEKAFIIGEICLGEGVLL